MEDVTGKNKGRKLYWFVMCILLIVFVVSGISLAVKLINERNQGEDFKILSNMVYAVEHDDGGKAAKEAAYGKLFEQNNNFIGWITIPGTKVDYPVMQSPESPDFYLNHDFNKEKSTYGVPYVDALCNVTLPSDNLLIYGHAMKNETMFGSLKRYVDENFYRDHHTIYFDTLTDMGEYQIISVFKTTADKNGYPYWEFIHADSTERYDSYIKNIKKLSMYETGVTAKYGDKLISLSTCEYTRKEGRLVVVAKKVSTTPISVLFSESKEAS